jgi:hypothetical protein
MTSHPEDLVSKQYLAIHPPIYKLAIQVRLREREFENGNLDKTHDNLIEDLMRCIFLGYSSEEETSRICSFCQIRTDRVIYICKPTEKETDVNIITLSKSHGKVSLL